MSAIIKQRKGLGWFKDRLDFRDFDGSAPPSTHLPSEVDLRGWSPPIMDQGLTNSCVGHASASLFRYMRRVFGLSLDFAPSRSFIYWYARHVPRIGWEDVDEGAMPRDAMQTMISNGVVSEEEWPFNLDTINTRPLDLLLTLAKKHKIVEGKYVRMKANDNLYHLKYSLAQNLPFLIGVACYSSFFDTGSNGMVAMPRTNEIYEGGHLMWCNGFSDSRRVVCCPNSWSEREGDKGHFYLPYAYVENSALASDFWRIEGLT